MQIDLIRAVALATLLGVGSLGCGESGTGASGHAAGGEHSDESGDGDHGDGGDNGDGGLVGPDGDEFAQDACHGLHAEGVVVQAALDAAGAADVVVTPGDTTWVVHLPEGVTSFATLMLPAPHSDWAVFVDHPDVVVSFTNHETNDRFDIVPENPNASCPDDMAVDARVHIHTEGHHLIEFSADGAREIRFQMVSETAGHDGDGGETADAIAHGACDAITGEHIMLAASSTPQEALAGDVMMVGSNVYHVMLPDGPAYAAVHLTTDHTDWAVFLSEPNLALSVSNDEVGSFAVTPHNPNAACPEALQVDSRIHIHAGGIFVVEFAPTGAGEVLFNMVSEAEGHGDGGHDEEGEDDDHEGDGDGEGDDDHAVGDDEHEGDDDHA